MFELLKAIYQRSSKEIKCFEGKVFVYKSDVKMIIMLEITSSSGSQHLLSVGDVTCLTESKQAKITKSKLKAFCISRLERINPATILPQIPKIPRIVCNKRKKIGFNPHTESSYLNCE